MIYIVFGPVGAFTDKCVSLLSSALSHHKIKHDSVEVSSLGDIGKAVLRCSGNVIATARRPAADLIDHIREAQIPVLVAAPFAAAMLAFWMEQGADLVDAWRRTTADFSGLITLTQSSRTTLVRPVAPRDYGQLAEQIAGTWALDIDALNKSTAYSIEGNDPSLIYHPSQLEPAWNALQKPIDRHILSSAVAIDCSLGNSLRPISIPIVTLTKIEDLTPLTAAIDVTGRARGLICGPYIRLPTGRWSARLELEVSGNLKDTVWVADVVHLKYGQIVQLARSEFQSGDTVPFEVNLPFYNDDPNSPLEVRLFVTKAIFDGLLSVVSLLVVPDPDLEYRQRNDG